jgi:hypothetical protein
MAVMGGAMLWRWSAEGGKGPLCPIPPMTAGPNRPWRLEKKGPAAGRQGRTVAWVHPELREWFETRTGDTARQDRLLGEMTSELTERNAPAIVRSLSANEMGTPFGAEALARWLQSDPRGAANWMASRSETTQAQAAMVAAQMLEDPAAFQAYRDQLPDGGWKQNFLLQAGLQTLSIDPAVSIGLAQRMDPGSDQTNLLQTIVNDWVGQDSAAAESWIMQVNDPDLRDLLIAAAAKAQAATAPRQATAWVLEKIQSETVAGETMASIIETWASRKPAEADAYVRELGEGGLSSQAPMQPEL